jgi:hypothetical protein
MRKSLSGLAGCLSLLCSFPSSVHAGVGLKGGFSLSGLHSATGDFRHVLGYEMDWLRMGNLAGFQIGMFQTFDVSRSLALQPEVYLAVRGGESTGDFEFDQIVSRTEIRYLEFPVLLEYRVPLQRRLRPSLFLGPYGAVKLSAARQTVIRGREERIELDNVNAVDYGVVVGGAVEHEMLSGQLILDVRCSLGLKNAMRMPAGYIRLYVDEDEIRNFAFSLMVGYRF